MDCKKPDSHDDFIENLDVSPGEHGVNPARDPKYEDGFTKKEQKQIIRKVDLRLVAGPGLLMGVCLIDRTNLGSTSIAGYALERAVLYLS